MSAVDRPLISVVVPVYGCRSCLKELARRVTDTVENIPARLELIFINDASPDNAWALIEEMNREDNRIKGINFARNFGQHRAITAGIDHAAGDWVVVMDCDLQDKPEEIDRLYRKALEGYDIVFGKRVDRQDKWLKRKGSQLFYKIFDYFTERSSDHMIANYSISNKKVVDGFRSMREQNRNFPLFIQWMGFATATIHVEHCARKQGKSSYDIRKLVMLAMDTIISQSNKPLRLSIQFGFFISLISFIYGIYLFIRYFFLNQTVHGWTSVMVSIYFIGGLLFSNLGILGLYIGKVFNETKGRPLYLIKETTNDATRRETD